MSAAFLAALVDPATWPAPDAIALVIGAILPIIVAVATHLGAAGRVKAIVNTVLAFLAGPVTMWITGPGAGIVSKLTASNAVAAYVLSLVTYFAFWKPVFDINAKLAPDFGIGRPKA